MNRKTIKTRTGAYHVTLPIRLVEDFDERLEFKQSRSKLIANLIRNYLALENSDLALMSSLEILELLVYRFPKDSSEDTLIQALIKLLS